MKEVPSSRRISDTEWTWLCAFATDVMLGIPTTLAERVHAGRFLTCDGRVEGRIEFAGAQYSWCVIDKRTKQKRRGRGADFRSQCCEFLGALTAMRASVLVHLHGPVKRSSAARPAQAESEYVKEVIPMPAGMDLGWCDV